MSVDVPALPFNEPSVEESVNEYLQVIAAVKNLRREMSTALGQISHLISTRTTDRLELGGVERRLDKMEARMGALENGIAEIGANVRELLARIGVTRG